jgi:hypothetical protein
MMESAATQLDEGLCWALLARGSFGCVALSAHAMPMIVPVRYTVGRRALRVSPPEDAGIDGALAETVVAFQATGFDDDAHRAWRVHLVGRATGDDAAGFEIQPSVIEGNWLTFC